MNATRRKQIEEISSKLDGLKSEIEDLQSEELDTYENMPESLKQGERGQASEMAADQLQQAVDSIDGALSSLEEASA